MKTGLITSDTFENHDTGPGHPEQIARISVINENFKKLNIIFKSMVKKAKCKFNINYQVSGEAFLTKPNKTTYMVQNVIKKITKIKPKLSTTGGTSDARFIRKIAPCLEFGLVGKTMHKVDESVPLSDLKKLSNIYLNILDNYFK